MAVYSIHQVMAFREHEPVLSDELQERVRTLLSAVHVEHAAPERPQSPSRKQRAEGAAGTEKKAAGEGAKPRQKGASARARNPVTTIDPSRRYTIEELLSIRKGMTHFGPTIPSLRAIRLKHRERFWDLPAAPSGGGVSSAFLLQDGDEDDECTMEAMSRATMEESMLEEQMARTASTDAFGPADDPLFGSSSSSSRPAQEEEDEDDDAQTEPAAAVSPFASILGETSPADIALGASATSAAFVESEEELESPFLRFGASPAAPAARTASQSVFPPMPAGLVLSGGDLMSGVPARQTASQPSLLAAFGVADQGQVPPLPATASVAMESPEPVDLLALSASQGATAAAATGLVLPPLPPAVAVAAAAAAATPDLPALPVSAVFESGGVEASSLPAPSLPALPEGAIVVGSEREGQERAAAALPALPEGTGVASIDELESVSAPATPVKAPGRSPRKPALTPQVRSRQREERGKILRQRRALRYLAQSNPASVSVSETLRASGRSTDDDYDDEEEEDEEEDVGSINVHVGIDEATVKALYHGKISVPESPQRRASPARAHDDRGRAPARGSDTAAIPLVLEAESPRRPALRVHRPGAAAAAVPAQQHKRPTATDFPPLGVAPEPEHPQTVVILARAADAPAPEDEEPVLPAHVPDSAAVAAAEDEMMAFFMQ